MKVVSGYGLLHKKSKELLGVYGKHTDADCSVGTIYTLSCSIDKPWIVGDLLTASYVRKFSTNWYNADYETPINPYKPEELSVVQIEMFANEVETAFIPTFEEFMKYKYDTKGKPSYSPGHCEMVMRHIKERGCRSDDMKYHLSDLQLLLHDYKGSLK